MPKAIKKGSKGVEVCQFLSLRLKIYISSAGSARLLCLSDHIVTQRIKTLSLHMAGFTEKTETGKDEIICSGFHSKPGAKLAL